MHVSENNASDPKPGKSNSGLRSNQAPAPAPGPAPAAD